LGKKKKSGNRNIGKGLTSKQIRLVKAFLKAKSAKQPITKGEAAEEAGYSPKNPTQSANQALAAIRLKAPEIMDKLGLSVETLIEKHLTPLLNAEETKLVIHEGKVTERVNLADNTTRRYATRMAFELQGAFPPQDPQLAAQVGVEVLILDVPRPDRSAINVTPPPTKQKVMEPSGNGAKPDPRPKD